MLIGMKRVSIRDVAKAAGVSITTVSKALNNYPDVSEQTKKRIEAIVQEMDYVPDMAGRSMGGITSLVIGLLINDLMPEEPSGAVYGFLSGVCTACKDNGIEFLLITTDSETQKHIPLKRLCLGKGLSGLVCSGFRLNDPYIQQINAIDIPCACIDLETGNSDVFDVTIDNVCAAEEAVQFLIKNGRKNIALIYGNYQADVSNRRMQGYCNALKAAGLPLLEKRMVSADFNENIAYRKMQQMLEKDSQVDAVFCVSDLMALGVCRAVEEAGLTVGKDVAVVGFDDIPIARYVYGGLTTIRQDFYAMGYTAGRLIYEKITGQKSVASPGELLYKLMVRRTAASEENREVLLVSPK